MYEIILNYIREINLLLASRTINQLERKNFMNKIRVMVKECGSIFLNNEKP